jgi:hypothetical protein
MKFIARVLRRPVFCVLVGVLVGVAFYVATDLWPKSGNEDDELLPAGITGVNHLGPKYNIGEFYVNGYYASNVGREGGGGGTVCCAMIPRKWRPGLVVEVKWGVNDWSKEVRAEIDAQNYRSLSTEGLYIATVPVEKYDPASDVVVHFFPGGKVRVLSSMLDVMHPDYPIPYGQREGDEKATIGRRVKDLFEGGLKERPSKERRFEWK